MKNIIQTTKTETFNIIIETSGSQAKFKPSILFFKNLKENSSNINNLFDSLFKSDPTFKDKVTAAEESIYKDLSESYGVTFPALRTSKGFSQSRLAMEIGLLQPNLSRTENSRTSMDLDKLVKISDLLGVSIDEVVKAFILQWELIENGKQ